MMMKWLWRYGTEDFGLWKEVIKAKHGELTHWSTKVSADAYGVGPPEELFDEKKPNISSHAVGLRSQTDDNFTSYFGEVPPILDYFDCQTYPKNSQKSSILSSHRQFNEHYQSHHHNNQLPTDQFVMNRPDVSPISSPPFEPYDPRYAAMGLPMDPYLRAFKLNPNLGLAKPNE
uniref:Uncharacterized protein n=1 Tax=Solanum tuberosum TaxID=4113 RepID=M1CB15_SOLTU